MTALITSQRIVTSLLLGWLSLGAAASVNAGPVADQSSDVVISRSSSGITTSLD